MVLDFKFVTAARLFWNTIKQDVLGLFFYLTLDCPKCLECCSIKAQYSILNLEWKKKEEERNSQNSHWPMTIPCFESWHVCGAFWLKPDFWVLSPSIHLSYLIKTEWRHNSVWLLHAFINLLFASKSPALEFLATVLDGFPSRVSLCKRWE